MITLVVRLVPDPTTGLRGSVESPGGEPVTFKSEDQLIDSIYAVLEDSAGKGSGSISNSAMRAT